jgi:tRNA(Ile)-lysidine synthase TilS/MesJ
MIKINPQFVPAEFTLMVSGGVDSIAAAHWLIHKYRKKFHLIHFNHKVQEANDDMEKSVWNFYMDHYDFFKGGRFVGRDILAEPAFIDYAEAKGLMKYVVEDPTNKENKNKRNWIRNIIIPQLEEKELGLETLVRKKFYV